MSQNKAKISENYIFYIYNYAEIFNMSVKIQAHNALQYLWNQIWDIRFK